MATPLARAIAEAIKKDMEGRSQGDWWWGGIDEDVQEDILNSWAQIVSRGMEGEEL